MGVPIFCVSNKILDSGKREAAPLSLSKGIVGELVSSRHNIYIYIYIHFVVAKVGPFKKGRHCFAYCHFLRFSKFNSNQFVKTLGQICDLS